MDLGLRYGMLQKRPFYRRHGFTLIELMLVVAIIGVLASIAIPKMTNLINRSREGQTKGILGSFRAAIKVYYADTGGLYPTDEDGLVPKYLDAIPTIRIPPPTDHLGSSNVTMFSDDWATGAWLYDQTIGSLYVNCTHSDSKGIIWSMF